MSITNLLLAVALLSQLSGTSPSYAADDGNPVIERCLIKLPGEYEIRIPAQEAGVLTEMPVP